MMHDLKVWPDFFDALADGSKPYEVRKGDRKYQVGDVLLLREWIPTTAGFHAGVYSGRELRKRVTHVQHGMGQVGVVGPCRGVSLGFVIMGLIDSPEVGQDVARHVDRTEPGDDSGAQSEFPGM